MWWPWQSHQAKVLCGALSVAERAGLGVVMAVYPAWLVYAVGMPLVRLLLNPGLPAALSALYFLALTVCFTYVYLCVAKCYLLLTREGRRLAYRADALALFRFDEREGEPRHDGATGGRTET